ncbi:MAG: sugar transferase [Candidatus Yanofskybacteria bacterium]|nr:sugar transferase [Candidatus Yanofskybacteria bacterium]
MKKADFYFNVARLPVDAAMLVAAGIATYLLRTRILDIYRPVLFEFNLPLLEYLYLVVVVSGILIGFFAASGLYSMKQRMRVGEEFTKLFVASAAGVMLIIIYIFLRQELFNSRFLVLGGWFFALLFVFIGRLLMRFIQNQTVSKYNFGIQRLLVIGNDEVTQRLMYAIIHNPSLGYRLVKHLDYPEISEVREAIPGIDEVILGNPNIPEDKITELIELCNEHHMVFKFIPNVYQTLTKHFDIDVVYNTPLIELKRTSLDGWGRVAKRIVDVGFSAAALVVLSPIFAICALAIRIEGRGPIFVKLRRISKNREFNLYKFRSMVPNAEELKSSLFEYNERNDGPLFKIKNDPRVTPVGKILRKFRLDEMPQFWNILKGDISLVGPRPHQPDEISRYEKHHKKVLAIDAGATGLAQVSGSSDLLFEEEVTMDTFYIENWSLWMDLKIIGRTIFKVFSDRSAV